MEQVHKKLQEYEEQQAAAELEAAAGNGTEGAAGASMSAVTSGSRRSLRQRGGVLTAVAGTTVDGSVGASASSNMDSDGLPARLAIFHRTAPDAIYPF